MRKRILGSGARQTLRVPDTDWLNISEIATVEVTSEQESFPIENVFTGGGAGWRAAHSGGQVIRLLFDEPIAVSRIRLRFEEPERQRTQEFTLNWLPAAGGCRVIVRQQWNFSPAASTTEIEDYALDLESVTALELRIRPDIGGKDAFATLAQWQVAGQL